MQATNLVPQAVDHISTARGRLKNGNGAKLIVRQYLKLSEPASEPTDELRDARRRANRSAVELALKNYNFIFKAYTADTAVC